MQVIDSVKPHKRPLGQRRQQATSREGPLIGDVIAQPVPAQAHESPVAPRRVRQYPLRSHPRLGLRIPKRGHVSKREITLTLLVLAILIGGVVALRQPIGQLLIVAYGVVALIRGIPSRVTFICAMVALLLVPTTLGVFGGNNVISSAFATYAFLLLIIGSISIGLEVRHPLPPTQGGLKL